MFIIISSPPVQFRIYNNWQQYIPIGTKPFENRFEDNFAAFCSKALSEEKRKILNCLSALARVFMI
jgi:hypothetical protein